MKLCPVRVINPRRLSGWELPAERIAVGVPGDYKPSMALLPSGELVVTGFCSEALPNDKHRETALIWRSTDGGMTWSERQPIRDMIGREQFISCTSDGILFTTGCILATDIANPDGVCHAYIHRSVDGGLTWERTKVMLDKGELDEIEFLYGVTAAQAATLTSRNVVELPDGELLLGVTVTASDTEFLWRSTDRGVSWSETSEVTIAEDFHTWDGLFSEDFTYRTVAGKLIHFVRVGHPSPLADMRDGRVVPSGNDNCDRTMICESTDNGRTWGKFRDFGDYGVMYPRVLRLQDGRLLATFTQRALFYPIGLRAVISYDDDETWDFNSDRIIIEGKTPWGMKSGGGFGNTVQLEDGTLVSCYSYRGTDNQPHVEVVRWSLDRK